MTEQGGVDRVHFGPSFGFLVGFLVAAQLAEELGSVPEALFWFFVSASTFRFAIIIWKRLELVRMAAALGIAGLLAALLALGTLLWPDWTLQGWEWVWLAGGLVSFVSLMAALLQSEGRRSPERLKLLNELKQNARFADRFTLRHIPDLTKP